MQFYLAVLDDKVRLEEENPSIGIILCKIKILRLKDVHFKSLPKEWIEHRLEKLQETLEKDTKQKVFYEAYSKLGTLSLLEESKGSNSLYCRTRSQRIRTIAQLEMKVKIPCHESVPIYKVLSEKIKELKALGLFNEEIAARLGINKKTVAKSLMVEI